MVHEFYTTSEQPVNDLPETACEAIVNAIKQAKPDAIRIYPTVEVSTEPNLLDDPLEVPSAEERARMGASGKRPMAPTWRPRLPSMPPW